MVIPLLLRPFLTCCGTSLERYILNQLDVIVSVFSRRVHEFEYLDHLEKKCRQSAGQQYDGLPFFASPAGKLDTDTPLTDQSLEAAKRFCG